MLWLNMTNLCPLWLYFHAQNSPHKGGTFSRQYHFPHQQCFLKKASKMKTEFGSKLNYSSQPIWTKCKHSPWVQALSSLGRCSVKVGQWRQVQRQISQSLRSEPKHGSKRSAANWRVKNKSDQNRNSISNSTADFHIPAQDVGIWNTANVRGTGKFI